MKDIPQWYFWTLLGLSLFTIPALIYNYIKHHRERRKTEDVEQSHSMKFKSRGNISGKRQVFTLVRDPFRRSTHPQATSSHGKGGAPSGGKMEQVVAGIFWAQTRKQSADTASEADDKHLPPSNVGKVLNDKYIAGQSS